jgi:methyltransferase (TIGR00027 family)
MTARGVALARSLIERPSSPTGDAGAEARLVATLADGFTPRDGPRRRDGFFTFLVARTHFFDDAVIRAIGRDVRQIVILAAGYDARALRFRTPGVQFFEVDHPATQHDKRERLQGVGASLDGITFVAADFTEPGLDAALARAGHDASEPTQFLCEGLLRYLPEQSFRDLLRTTATVAAPGSELAASISTRPPGDPGPDEDEQARRDALATAGEAVLTVPPTATALQWLDDAGWSVVDAGDVSGVTTHGRLLVRAVRPVS